MSVEFPYNAVEFSVLWHSSNLQTPKGGLYGDASRRLLPGQARPLQSRKINCAQVQGNKFGSDHMPTPSRVPPVVDNVADASPASGQTDCAGQGGRPWRRVCNQYRGVRTTITCHSYVFTQPPTSPSDVYHKIVTIYPSPPRQLFVTHSTRVIDKFTSI